MNHTVLAMDQPDSLEDWVSIKDHPFLASCKQKSKLDFHVAWNEIEGKITVTCRQCQGGGSQLITARAPLVWTGAYTLSELRAIHEQLSLVHPSLGPYLPNLPKEQRGLWWTYASFAEPLDEATCYEICKYFKTAHDVCGERLLVDTLFEEHSPDEYFEKIGELKRRAYDDAVAHADDELQNVLFLRSGSINMLDMMEVYKLEDTALFKLNVAQAELYNYFIQPFLDMREIAFARLREAKLGLQNDQLGDRRKVEYATMFTEWQDTYVHALDRIQELYTEYYGKTVTILEGLHMI